MQFFKNLWRRKLKIGAYFGSTPFEIGKFQCGIGESVIRENTIWIENYPFEPSNVYPSREIHVPEINEIHLDCYPLTLKIEKELIFISRNLLEDLKNFATQNDIPIKTRTANWNWITEPYLDTEFDQAQKEKTIELLISNGISAAEIEELRTEIADQMYKYNFDTMLWEWGILGLYDVLIAMQPKYSKSEFEQFYWKAMEIEQRTIKNAV